MNPVKSFGVFWLPNAKAHYMVASAGLATFNRPFSEPDSAI